MGQCLKAFYLSFFSTVSNTNFLCGINMCKLHYTSFDTQDHTGALRKNTVFQLYFKLFNRGVKTYNHVLQGNTCFNRTVSIK